MSNKDRQNLEKLYQLLKTTFPGSAFDGLEIDDVLKSLRRVLDA